MPYKGGGATLTAVMSREATSAFNTIQTMPPVDKEALIDLLLKVSSICVAYSDISELDINPVVAHEHGYSVIDAQIVSSNKC